MAAELAEESAAWDAALLEANGAWDTSKKHLMAFARGFPRLFLHETGMTAEEYLKMVEEDESADELRFSADLVVLSCIGPFILSES